MNVSSICSINFSSFCCGTYECLGDAGGRRGRAAGEDGGLVVAGAGGVARGGALRGGALPVHGASPGVGDRPLCGDGRRSGGCYARTGRAGEVGGQPVLHEVHSGSVHLEAVVAVRRAAGVGRAVVVVRGAVGGHALGDAEGLSAALAGGRGEAVGVDLGLGAALQLLRGAVIWGPSILLIVWSRV